MMWIAVAMVMVPNSSPPTPSSVTPPTSGTAVVGALEFLIFLAVLTLSVAHLCSCPQDGAVQSCGYAVVSAGDVSG